MKKGNEYEFEIKDIEFPGYGIAIYDDKKVFIKNAVPGQKVKARISKKRKGYLEGKVTEIIEDVDYAIKPQCRHFGICGGCTQQFLPYEKQLELKKMEVLKLFEKAKIDGFEFLGIEKSPEEFNYRNKMEFTFGDYEKGGELSLGMHMKNRGFGITTVDGCMIIDEDFRVILKSVLDYFKSKGIPHYRVISHEGYLRNLVVRKAKYTGEIMINIVTSSQIDFDYHEITEMLKKIKYSGTLTGIIHTINDTLSDMVKPEKIEVLYGRDYIIEELLEIKFRISPFSFFQTNSKGAEKLYSIVRDFLGDTSDKTVFDLYCGTGTIGQIAAKNSKKVLGIELVEEAVKTANENAAFNGLTNCEFIAGDIAEVIKTVKYKPDAIILDPPRPGVHPKALEYVLKFNAREIIYVSCNPKTLCNDLKVITENGYKIEKVILMDMFPHTVHIETVVKIERK